ncbi:MAG: TolB family protein [Candidatus Rokuibacteriota bacterium]
MKAGLRSVAAIAISLVLVAGCTAEPERELPDGDADRETESPSATSPSAGVDGVTVTGVPGAIGRIALLDELGTLVAFDADGSDVDVLAESVPGASLVRQPTWSPDGARLAWVRLDADGTSAALVTTTGAGTGTTETRTAATPFYLFWDPTSSRIAYLGSSAEADIELGIVDVVGGDGAVALDSGSPFYLSWDPTGEQMLVHVGTDRLERLAIDGTLTTVHDRPGTFNAPVWTSDGRSLLYASDSEGGQRLVAHDLDADRREDLVRFDGAITFVVSPDGSRVAFQVLRAPDDVAPLSVLDRATGAIERVATGFVPAFFWSPEGDKLLHLLPEVAPDRVWFRWGVWDGESSFSTPRFYPSLVFGRDYLQFFEQYAQSMSLWAPDGSAFVYAGSSEAGETGVWIQQARSGTEPVLVANGVFATWSPATKRR